jgi:hypothetical protein
MQGQSEPTVGDANKGIAMFLFALMAIFLVGLIVVYIVADV